MAYKTSPILGIRNNWNRINQHVNHVFSRDYRINDGYPANIQRNRDLPLTYNIVGEPRKTASQDEMQTYYSLIPRVIKDLTNSCDDIPEVMERHENLLEYNLPNHFQASGLSVVCSYKAFESMENLTSTNIYLSQILGWCVDLLLCSYYLNDDIIDESETRRGLTCWNKIEGVGLQAIIDAIAIEHGPYVLLKKYFSKHTSYIQFMETIHDVNLKTSLGMTLDMMNRLNGEPNLEEFTIKRFKALAKYKLTYGEFLLPIKLGMHLSNKYSYKEYKPIKNVLIQLGEYFMAQNDILDCYGDSSITGKSGNDIGQGKCTWLVVNALERATQAQRKLLKQHYGKPGCENKFKIRIMYEELGILDRFLKYEEESYKMIYENVKQMSTNLPQKFFAKLVDTAYGNY